MHIVKVALDLVERLDVRLPLLAKLAHHLHNLGGGFLGVETFGGLTHHDQKRIQREGRTQHNFALERPVDECWVGFMNKASDAFVGHEQQHIVEGLLGG